MLDRMQGKQAKGLNNEKWVRNGQVRGSAFHLTMEVKRR